LASRQPSNHPHFQYHQPWFIPHLVDRVLDQRLVAQSLLGRQFDS
jgi:hypothetical protein